MGQTYTYERSTAPPTDREVTPDELLHNPQWGRCELVDGKVIQMSPAGRQHGVVAGRILGYIFQYLLTRPLGELYAAETGFIFPNGKTVRAPDVMFLSSVRITPELSETGFVGIVPDFAVEVVSPEQPFAKMVEKVESYLKIGLKLAWIVEPDDQTIHVYKPSTPVQVFHLDDTLSCENILPGFELKVRHIFAR